MNGIYLTGTSAASWTYAILFGLFFLVCLRVRGNYKFVSVLFRDLVEVRERHNVFDDTVRESSFIFLLLLLSVCSCGAILSMAAKMAGPVAGRPDWIPEFEGMSGVLVCMALCGVYVGVMWLIYKIVGTVFSDPVHTWVWVRGFTAGMGLGSLVFFPLALLSIAYPENAWQFMSTAFVMLILVKIIFIFKGFRIFFTESSLWVVFLYYLCSLEIVPLIIIFGLARALAG